MTCKCGFTEYSEKNGWTVGDCDYCWGLWRVKFCPACGQDLEALQPNPSSPPPRTCKGKDGTCNNPPTQGEICWECHLKEFNSTRG